MPTFDAIDAEICAERELAWNAIAGPRVGDFVWLADNQLRRLAHEWTHGWEVTLDEGSGLFFLGSSGVSYCGNPDPNVCIAHGQLFQTRGRFEGTVHFSHHSDINLGWVSTEITCRVYQEGRS